MSTEFNPTHDLTEESNVDGLINLTNPDTHLQETHVKWQIGDCTVDKDFIQFIIIYFCICCIVITCLINLSLESEKSELWISLLSVMCGIIMPQPYYSTNKKPAQGEES